MTGVKEFIAPCGISERRRWRSASISFSGAPSISRPRYKMLPRASPPFGRSPSIVITTLLLPLPDSPISPQKEFSRSAKEISFTAFAADFDRAL